MTIKLYKVNIYQAYRADEQGIRWFAYNPSDTTDYKHEIMSEIEIELPKGITYDKEFNRFDDNNHECQLITEKDGSAWLVSSDRMVKLTQ